MSKRLPKTGLKRRDALRSREQRADSILDMVGAEISRSGRAASPDSPGVDDLLFGRDVGQRKAQPSWLREFILAGRERSADKFIDNYMRPGIRQVEHGWKANKANAKTAAIKDERAQRHAARVAELLRKPGMTEIKARRQSQGEMKISEKTEGRYWKSIKAR